MGILRLFLCKFSLRWGALPPHSLVPVLPYLFPGGYCFFRPKAFVSTTCSVFRRTEPTARADVVSWADESRECAWTFTSFSSVNSPSAGKLCRFIRWPPPAPRVRGQMSRVDQRIPRIYVDIHWLFLCKFSLRWWALPSHSLASARAVGLAGKCRRVGQRIPRIYVDIHWLFLCKFFPRWGAFPLHSQASDRPCARGASRCRFVGPRIPRMYAWTNSGILPLEYPLLQWN